MTAGLVGISFSTTPGEADYIPVGHNVRLGEEPHACFTEPVIGSVEIVYRNGEMAQAWVLHGLLGPVAFRGNNLEHRAVGRFDEVIAVVLKIDDEIEMIHVPLSEVSGVG